MGDRGKTEQNVTRNTQYEIRNTQYAIRNTKHPTAMAEATVYLGLGSNLGDRLENLRRALEMLAEAAPIETVSSVYETAPWGVKEQPRFLNAVCRARTTFPPERLLEELQRIEKSLGRQRKERWGPRLVDLDILFYDELVLDTPELTIPHPLLHERAFVLVPLAEIAPGLYHPRMGKTVAELLQTAPDRIGVRYYSPPASLWDKAAFTRP